MQRMTIEATSKENDYSKQCFNLFQRMHIGITNKLLQNVLWKRTHSSRQPEAAVVTHHHTVGENGLGLNRPWHYYQIMQEVFYQQWFRWHGRLYIVWLTAWQIWHWLQWRRRWHLWWHMNRYNRYSLKIVMMMNLGVLDKFVDFSVSYTQVRL